VRKLAEARAALGVAVVGLGAVPLSLTNGLKLGGGNDADADRVLDQEGGQGFAIAAGRFPTEGRGREPAPPGEERRKAGGRVGEDRGLVLTGEPGGDGNVGFGDGDPDGGDRR
jgi:hypothetical protein